MSSVTLHIFAVSVDVNFKQLCIILHYCVWVLCIHYTQCHAFKHFSIFFYSFPSSRSHSALFSYCAVVSVLSCLSNDIWFSMQFATIQNSHRNIASVSFKSFLHFSFDLITILTLLKLTNRSTDCCSERLSVLSLTENDKTRPNRIFDILQIFKKKKTSEKLGFFSMDFVDVMYVVDNIMLIWSGFYRQRKHIPIHESHESVVAW